MSQPLDVRWATRSDKFVPGSKRAVLVPGLLGLALGLVVAGISSSRVLEMVGGERSWWWALLWMPLGLLGVVLAVSHAQRLDRLLKRRDVHVPETRIAFTITDDEVCFPLTALDDAEAWDLAHTSIRLVAGRLQLSHPEHATRSFSSKRLDPSGAQVLAALHARAPRASG